jgi:glutathione S-transferase
MLSLLVFPTFTPTRSQCYQEQPAVMPRPDLELLGVKYRRIPILAIGRDVYLDTRLILRKLEEKFPDGKLGSDKPEERFVEKLLEKHMVEGRVFATAAGLVPIKFVKDPTFVRDRSGFLGREWTAEALDAGRPECLAYVKNMFDLFETTILSDGRNWVLNTQKPSLADIKGVWSFRTTAVPSPLSEQWTRQCPLRRIRVPASLAC